MVRESRYKDISPGLQLYSTLLASTPDLQLNSTQRNATLLYSTLLYNSPLLYSTHLYSSPDLQLYSTLKPEMGSWPYCIRQFAYNLSISPHKTHRERNDERRIAKRLRWNLSVIFLVNRTHNHNSERKSARGKYQKLVEADCLFLLLKCIRNTEKESHQGEQ